MLPGIENGGRSSPISRLRELGQSLWLDNISRAMLDGGSLRSYIEDLSVTGLTSNPTIFNEAMGGTSAYDDSIREKSAAGCSGEALFEELALEDLRRAADLFRPIFDATAGIDGWVSMELAPVLADSSAESIRAAARIWRQADRQNLFIKIPGTPAGMVAIEESIFAGVPINVTLLFSPEHYLATAHAYLRGIERRIDAGLNPQVGSVASIFVSRWDRAVNDKLPDDLRNRLGIAIAARTYRAYCELLDSRRWRRLVSAGARPQRLLWASTGSKDPIARDTLYIEALAAPGTINTMPEKTLHAFAEHGQIDSMMTSNGGDCEAILARFAAAAIDVDKLAAELQREGAQAFVKSWRELLQRLAAKSVALTAA